MTIDIQTPNITAQGSTEQLLQMRSYLYQLSNQLNWAFSAIEGSGSAPAAQQQEVVTYVGRQPPQETFSQIKDLIIKSADIVDAYYEKINSRLEGAYVAQSDFGTYQQQTSLDIQETSTGIAQLYQNTQAISNTLNELYDAQIATNAYIRTGLLNGDEDGDPVYGLEIGQKNYEGNVETFSKFARFSADRLSFYDRNDTEIAYISDYRLNITNADVTGSLFLTNRFKIYYAKGLAFKWVGGSGNG